MSSHGQRGSVRFKDMEITFEGPREFVEAMVVRFANAGEWVHKSGQDLSLPEPSQLAPQAGVADLIAKKKPRGHHEIIAVLAFALTESGTQVFGEEDIHRAYIRAEVRPPKVIAQALRDAKNKYQYVELAGKRGRYRITNHGDRVVRFDLPRRGDSNEE